MKLDELTFEIKTKSGEYRPCLVADVKGFFHMWTPEGEAIVEFDDGTVSTVKAEDIRFLDTESLMAESACFSDEWIERFKSEKETDKVSQFFAELERLAVNSGYIVGRTYNDELALYKIRIVKVYDDRAMSVLGFRNMHLTDILYYRDVAYAAKQVFDQIVGNRKEVE